MFDFDEIEETAEREGGWKEGADGETPVGAGAVEGASGGAAAQDEKGMFDFDDLEDTLPAMSSKVVPSSADMQVEVLFQHQGEAWTRSYQVASASTVLDLKKQIGDEVKSIQLCRFGRPLADGDLLKENERLHFAFVGPRSPTATRQRPKPVENTWAGDEEVTIVLDAALHLCQTRRVPKARRWPLHPKALASNGLAKGTSVAGLKAAMAKEDPTNATQAKDFELGICGGSGHALAEEVVLSDIGVRHLDLLPALPVR
ncbi:unnamed protein product [Durusdinium trenchii]|uniref:Ubiquitin-like domain-containing protein n=1 Tax=Durusdinium trenchii TaxID=1381693 RepID=A0ABP0S7U4_9DINO